MERSPNPRRILCDGTFNKRVEHFSVGKRSRRKTTELSEVGNHMGLIVISRLERCNRPIRCAPSSRICQPSLEPCEPAIKFGCYTDAFAEYPGQMLPGNPCVAS
jgi:hypothetical protein